MTNQNFKLLSNDVVKLQYNINWQSFKNKIGLLKKFPPSKKVRNSDSYYYIDGYKKIYKSEIKEINEYLTFLNPYISDYAFKILNLPYDSEMTIRDLWLINYKKGGFIMSHSHLGTSAIKRGRLECIATCLYLNKEDDISNIEFQNKDTNTWNEIKVKKSDVLIFNGNINHRSTPSNVDDRWIMGINFTTPAIKEKQKNIL